MSHNREPALEQIFWVQRLLPDVTTQIYDNPAWPKDPLFYVCAPSVTDDSVAPEGCENLFLLVPTRLSSEGNQLLRGAGREDGTR